MGISKPKDVDAKPEEKVRVKKPKVKPKAKRELRAVIRILGTDLDGEKPTIHALRGVKGISYSMSKAICMTGGFNPNKKLGSLDEREVEKLEEVIKNPIKFGVPAWVVNRRKDMEGGKDLHVTSSDVDVIKKFDIRRMIDKKSYKGVRHMLGLPVRGQRTRSSFRKGRTVGVVRKAVRIAMEKKGEKKG